MRVIQWNLTVALALIGFSLTPTEISDSAPFWLAIKMLAALLVLAACVLTRLHSQGP